MLRSPHRWGESNLARLDSDDAKGTKSRRAGSDWEPKGWKVVSSRSCFRHH